MEQGPERDRDLTLEKGIFKKSEPDKGRLAALRIPVDDDDWDYKATLELSFF